MPQAITNKLNSLLPTYKSVRLSSGIDRYGFSSVLAAKCKMPFTPRSFANWIHGWIWTTRPDPYLLHCEDLPRDVTQIVRNELEKDALVKAGYKRVIIGGLPFAYIEKQHNHRVPNSLLAMPPHSAERERITRSQNEYFDYLESIRNEFECVFVSIHHLDWCESKIEAIKSRGLTPLAGARTDDANCLYRMRAIFDFFESVTSNTMGSHVVYAMFAGCKFSIAGPYYDFSDVVNSTSQASMPLQHQQQIDDLLNMYSERYVKSMFPHLMKGSPTEGQLDIGFGELEVGHHQKLGREEIITNLQWDLRGQARGYISGAIRRIKRKLR